MRRLGIPRRTPELDELFAIEHERFIYREALERIYASLPQPRPEKDVALEALLRGDVTLFEHRLSQGLPAVPA